MQQTVAALTPLPGSRPQTGGPARRRVRTGCLTCRKKRRKCDEAKPECTKCKQKSLTCRYGVNLTFIDSTPECFSGRRRQKMRVEVPRGESIISLASQDDGRQALEGGDTPSILLPQADRLSDGPEFTPLDEGVVVNLSGDATSSIERRSPLSRSTEHISTVFDQQSPSQFEEPCHGQPDETFGLNILSGAAQIAQTIGFEWRQVVANAAPPDHNGLELLSHYRQNIAPLLDLGLSKQYFGVDILNRCNKSDALHNAIIALSKSHKAATRAQPQTHRNLEQTNNYARMISEQVPDSPQDQMSALLLVAWTVTYTDIPDVWLPLLRPLIDELHDYSIDVNQWHVFTRLLLATTILSSPQPNDPITTLILRPCPFDISHDSLHTEDQYLQSLVLLQRTLAFANGQTQTRGIDSVSAVSAWKNCWSESQSWYATRNAAMEQFLDVPESYMDSLHGNDKPLFPIVLFSSTCAILANIVHHLTCLVLLQHKYRTVQAVAETDSSASPIWHARRIVGICISAEENNKWDPLVVAAVVYASQRLSHEGQLEVVAGVLRKASQEGGMMLEREIGKVASLRSRIMRW